MVTTHRPGVVRQHWNGDNNNNNMWLQSSSNQEDSSLLLLLLVPSAVFSFFSSFFVFFYCRFWTHPSLLSRKRMTRWGASGTMMMMMMMVSLSLCYSSLLWWYVPCYTNRTLGKDSFRWKLHEELYVVLYKDLPDIPSSSVLVHYPHGRITYYWTSSHSIWHSHHSILNFKLPSLWRGASVPWQVDRATVFLSQNASINQTPTLGCKISRERWPARLKRMPGCDRRQWQWYGLLPVLLLGPCQRYCGKKIQGHYSSCAQRLYFSFPAVQFEWNTTEQRHSVVGWRRLLVLLRLCIRKIQNNKMTTTITAAEVMQQDDEREDSTSTLACTRCTYDMLQHTLSSRPLWYLVVSKAK